MIPLIIGAVVGATMAIIGNSSADKAALELYKKKAKVIIHGYNYNQKALDTAEKSTYYSAMGELFNLQVNALQNNSTVEASLNESGYSGRSSDQISRIVSGQTYRQRTAVKSAYEQQVMEIRSKKDALYIQADNALNNLQDETSDSMLGGFEKFMNVLNGAAIGAAAGAAGGALASGAAGSAGLTATGALGGTATNTLSASALSAGTAGTTASAGSTFLASTSAIGATAAPSSLVLTSAAPTALSSTAGASSLALTGSAATSTSTSLGLLGAGSVMEGITVQSAPVATQAVQTTPTFLEAFNSSYGKYSNILKITNSFTQLSQLGKRGRYV